MKITNIEQLEAFRAAVDKCVGNVWLTSNYGDKFNLKSTLNCYIALGALLGEHGDELELWCDIKQEESYFMEFFDKHPEVL